MTVAVLAPSSGFAPVGSFDQDTVSWTIDRRSDELTEFFATVSHLADPLVVTVVVAVVAVALLRVQRARLALVVVAATAFTAMTTTATKVLVDRARPPTADWLMTANGASFPSGHSAQSVALYGSLAGVVWITSRTRAARATAVVCAASIAVIVGCSRVYLGVHWPSDVLGGWLIAAAWLVTVLLVARRAGLSSGGRARSGGGRDDGGSGG